MLDDLTKEVKAQLYERVKSPLFGAFAFSWVGWNYRALLGAFSGMPFKDRMAYLDSLYPTTEDWFNHCAWWPLLTATLFLVIYPWPARAMYWYWAWQQKELKKVQQKIEDETPLTQEEANALRKAGLAQDREFQQRLRELTAINKDFEERIKLLQEDNDRLEFERDQHAEATRKAEEQLTESRALVLSGGTVVTPQQTSNGPISPSDIVDQLPEEAAVSLRSLGSQATAALVGLVALGGRATPEQIAKTVEANPIAVRHGLKELKGQGYIVEGGNQNHFLTEEGNEFVLSLNLTNYVPLRT